MKKLFSLLLALMMLLGMTALAETAVDYVGYWVMTGVEMAGVQVDPMILGLNAYMELYEDGSCMLVMMDEFQYGTWAVTENGITTTDANGVTDTYTYADGALVVEEEGNKLIFTPGEYVLPLSGLTMADFEGDWVFTYAEMGNGVFYPEEIGVDVSLSIHGEKGVFTASQTGETGVVTETFSGVCEIEEVPDTGTWLYFLFVDEAGNPNGDGLALTMFEGEELVWCVDDGSGLTFCYCFVRAEELAE
ncbi:MAG: hypothetical protein IJA83_07910 [Clostridia bacterium]|nr:hypothetical protein [Clostridia bacterium]